MIKKKRKMSEKFMNDDEDTAPNLTPSDDEIEYQSTTGLFIF